MADCKRKTANLFDLELFLTNSGVQYSKNNYIYTFTTNQKLYSAPFYFSNTDISVSISGIIDDVTSNYVRIQLLKRNGSVAAADAINKNKNKQENIICAGIRFNWNTSGEVKMSNIMLNVGSSPLPYEPYGWLHSLRKLGTSTDTITTLPIDLYADGTNATVGLVGNMSQTGTPTPQNPIQPSECGERTANLFDKDATDTSKGYVENRYLANSGDLVSSSLYCISEYIPIDADTTYTFFNGNAPNSPAICFYDANKIYISGESYNGSETNTVISPVGAKYCRVSYAKTFIDVIMLNTGSTALPYEPYGIKIPISSANTTTPVYLGEVESTRWIKKYEFTGQEDWSISNNERVLYTALADHLTSNELICYCSHYKSIANVSAMSALSNGECAFNNTLRWFYIKDNNYNDATTFKTYLQQQYANGTPVCVWYILATPTTGIVNEPLRKIGEYADTVSGVSIPTTTGKDTFDVLTTLKPSEVSLTYTGWHDATVEEWDGSQWQ